MFCSSRGDGVAKNGAADRSDSMSRVVDSPLLQLPQHREQIWSLDCRDGLIAKVWPDNLDQLIPIAMPGAVGQRGTLGRQPLLRDGSECFDTHALLGLALGARIPAVLQYRPGGVAL